jgi:hypothetical protein
MVRAGVGESFERHAFTRMHAVCCVQEGERATYNQDSEP